jgi:hypothetical protein
VCKVDFDGLIYLFEEMTEETVLTESLFSMCTFFFKNKSNQLNRGVELWKSWGNRDITSTITWVDKPF